MFVYEFVGDLAKYDLPDLLSEDGEVVQAGWKATELLNFLLRRSMEGFRSMSKAEQEEVELLLKRVFDPTGTVFAGRQAVHVAVDVWH
jgi:hypothetical protein